ncbi:MAG: cellulose synthase subunit BcsC-related outer membrane protein [Thermodesulfobacteriota bacterium]
MRPAAPAILAVILFASTVSAQVVERGGQGATVIREPSVRGIIIPQDAQPNVDRSAQTPRRAGPELPEAAIPPGRLLDMGWDRFASGDWALAEEAFSRALEQAGGETALRARMGLGYASVRLGKLDQARENFEAAVKAGYSPQESIPALLTVLKAQGRRAEMNAYVAMLPPDRRANWEQVEPVKPAPPQEPGVRELLAKAGTRPSPARLESLLARFSPRLDSCADGDVFLKITQGLAAGGRQDLARTALSRLLRCRGLDFGVRMGALYELASVAGPAVAREHLHRFRETAGRISPAQQKSLDELAVVLDKKEMGEPGISPARKAALARGILAVSPADPDALSVAAWDDLNSGRPGQALEAFRRVASDDPGRPGTQLGIGYALYHLGRLDEALSIAEAPSSAGNPDMKDLDYQVRVRKGFDAVEAKDYALALAEAAKALAVWPEGSEAREVLAWAAFGRGENDKAYALFEDRYKATSDKRFLSPMMLALSKQGKRVQAFETAAVLASDPAPQSREAAAKFYREQNAPILASKTSSPGDCCSGADTAMMDARGFVRGKTGDSGLSRLTEWTLPTGFSIAGKDGWRLGFSYSPSFLSSGSAPAAPYAGSYYARVQDVPQRNSLVTDVTVHTPNVSLDIEGPYRWRLEAGTTPIGGPVGVMPTFEAGVTTPTWEVRVHQKPVRESILSWVGQRDPYGSKPWGRVLRTGARASYVFTPIESWFFSLGGGADYLWGQNVADNVGLTGNASAGRTFKLGGNELALGAFATVKHFGRNLNFYTYGHGGYYSPDLLFIAGPFIRFRSPECKDYWFDVEASVGYMHESTAGAPKYPLEGASSFGLTSGQITELGGSYSGKTETKFSYSAKGEFLKLFTPHLAAGVFGGVSNAADYREAYGGLGMRFFFDPQTGFWAPKDLFRHYTPLDRD